MTTQQQQIDIFIDRIDNEVNGFLTDTVREMFGKGMTLIEVIAVIEQAAWVGVDTLRTAPVTE
jgi:hypothetical protein